MQNKIKIGVIGLGQMGTLHAGIYKKHPLAELTAICEFKDIRREEARQAFGCKAYKHYSDLLSDPDIDAVSIVLPDNMHRECVELAAACGKHILLEKPLAKDLEDGRSMYQVLKDYDKVFMTGFLLRYDPRFQMVKQALDSGQLGDIIHIYCRRNSPVSGPRRYVGASDLSMHVMIHDIDYINWFMGGPPVKVFAKGRSVLLKEAGMKDVIYAIATYESGAVACLEACWVLPENSPDIIDDRMELTGTKGTAYVEPCGKGIRIINEQGTASPDTRHWYETYDGPGGDLSEEIFAFIRHIWEGTRPELTPEDALNSLRVVDAIERSMSEQKEVKL